jgi:hypothetical protein
MALRFSSSKVEKLLGIPTDIQSNQYYLVESSGFIQLYLSDSKGNLWPLIGTGITNGANINKTADYIISQLEFGSVYEINGATGQVNFMLPDIANVTDNEEYSFAVTESTGMLVAASGGAVIYMGDIATGANGAIESAAEGSFVNLRAIAGNWVARYLTGQWDLLDYSALTYDGAYLTYDGNQLYYYA